MLHHQMMLLILVRIIMLADIGQSSYDAVQIVPRSSEGCKRESNQAVRWRQRMPSTRPCDATRPLPFVVDNRTAYMQTLEDAPAIIPCLMVGEELINGQEIA